MATPVIQSVSTGAGDASTSVTITKPTGLAVGNLMVALIFNYDVSDRLVSDKTGWTTLDATNNVAINAKSFWKIADAGDVAAANFTFDFSSTADSGRGLIFRITGHSASAPIATNYMNAYISGTAAPSWSVTFDPKASDALLIMGVMGASMVGSSSTISGYTISGTNPTWTEHYDNSETTEHTLGVATAAGNSAASITSFGATFSSSSSRAIGVLLSIPSSDPVAATPASIAVRVQQSAPSFAAAVNSTPASIALRVRQTAPTARARENRWVDEVKTATTWTNETK